MHTAVWDAGYTDDPRRCWSCTLRTACVAGGQRVSSSSFSCELEGATTGYAGRYQHENTR